MHVLFFSLLMFSTFARADVATPLPEGTLARARFLDYAPVRNLTLRILEEYPLNRYHYVGVGRAPTVLIAMTQAILGEEAARNLPLSGMRHLHPPIQPEPREDGSIGPVPARLRFVHYTPENLERLARHFEDFLPTKLEGKKLLFLDWGHYGYTLTNLKREFEAAMTKRSPDARLDADYLALIDAASTLPTKLAPRGIRTMVCSGHERYLVDVLYKNFSEYGQWPVHLDAVDRPKRRTRSELRRRLRREFSMLFLPGVKQDVHFRPARREFYKKYLAVRSYDDLVAAYAARVVKDPYVREFRERQGLIQDATYSRFERARMTCEKALGRYLPF